MTNKNGDRGRLVDALRLPAHSMSSPAFFAGHAERPHQSFFDRSFLLSLIDFQLGFSHKFR
jgi:hypothetical protein